ncbi:hypothetical protein BCV72DRAFT_260454 [Rhizopus microsporus var. microsporus]|uniref:Uncharacterized protein n=2 Tax=Rhizopus microsporus TaxID=58291 RepID=A0A2G4T2H0_RHIZD|nr:uncharacterized protein RHIMIDRAFT_311326 [Rhizopus microsporus ATCC 52813]ORE10008.1 hypothetical protein BCV72DRAFT_260454 [Rhizopus microsporus var. microsporus]PHZ15213.1 hypothetical protein RHIMIDRAFT_311326 [Rhizopus microsporus ATCC 52813]
MEKAKFNYEVNRDLVYYFDDTQIEIIYTQPGTTEKSRQHILVSDLQIDAEKLQIKHVLSCRLHDQPKLIIACVDSDNHNHFFWHSVITKECKRINFETPIVGNITQAKITNRPFEVNYVYKNLTAETKMCYALVIGIQNGSTVLILLHIDHSLNISISFKYLENEDDNIGHVTAIYILPQDAEDRRMGHHDPQILLGYSKGAIRIYRFRATVYSFKASRIRSPIDLSEFTEFPGYPITHLSCARTYTSLRFIAAFAQAKPDDDAKYENATSYVKIVEFNGPQRQVIKHLSAPTPTALATEAQLMPHHENGIDLTIVFYSQPTYKISVWYLDDKQQLTLTLEREIDESACIQQLHQPTYAQVDMKEFLLRKAEKVVEYAFPHHAVCLKRKATTVFFEESLAAIEAAQVKKERLSHKIKPGYKEEEGWSLIQPKNEIMVEQGRSPYSADELPDSEILTPKVMTSDRENVDKSDQDATEELKDLKPLDQENDANAQSDEEYESAEEVQSDQDFKNDEEVLSNQEYKDESDIELNRELEEDIVIQRNQEDEESYKEQTTTLSTTEKVTEIVQKSVTVATSEQALSNNVEETIEQEEAVEIESFEFIKEPLDYDETDATGDQEQTELIDADQQQVDAVSTKEKADAKIFNEQDQISETVTGEAAFSESPISSVKETVLDESSAIAKEMPPTVRENSSVQDKELSERGDKIEPSTITDNVQKPTGTAEEIHAEESMDLDKFGNWMELDDEEESEGMQLDDAADKDEDMTSVNDDKEEDDDEHMVADDLDSYVMVDREDDFEDTGLRKRRQSLEVFSEEVNPEADEIILPVKHDVRWSQPITKQVSKDVGDDNYYRDDAVAFGMQGEEESDDLVILQDRTDTEQKEDEGTEYAELIEDQWEEEDQEYADEKARGDEYAEEEGEELNENMLYLNEDDEENVNQDDLSQNETSSSGELPEYDEDEQGVLDQKDQEGKEENDNITKGEENTETETREEVKLHEEPAKIDELTNLAEDVKKAKVVQDRDESDNDKDSREDVEDNEADRDEFYDSTHHEYADETEGNNQTDFLEHIEEAPNNADVLEDDASLPEYEEEIDHLEHDAYEDEEENNDDDMYKSVKSYEDYEDIEADEDELKHYPDDQHDDEYEDYEEDQIKENYDEYIDTEGGYDKFEDEQLQENNDGNQQDFIAIDDGSDYAQDTTEQEEKDNYLEYPLDDEEIPPDYEYDEDDVEGVTNEYYGYSQDSTREPQSGAIEIISDDEENPDINNTEIIDESESSAYDTGMDSSSNMDEDITKDKKALEFKSAKEAAERDKHSGSLFDKIKSLYDLQIYKWGRTK